MKKMAPSLVFANLYRISGTGYRSREPEFGDLHVSSVSHGTDYLALCLACVCMRQVSGRQNRSKVGG